MGYVCMHCGKETKALERTSVRCTYCGYRVMIKKRSSLSREVPTD